MARKLRLEFPGAIYHVINRGNRRVGPFDQYCGAEAFERCLAEASKRYGWRVHAFVVMSNHFHLALETPEPNLCAGMQWLQTTFSSRLNRFRHESGHIFQGRFKTLIVENGQYLANLIHYIDLNPVRAKLCELEKLSEYPHGSYRFLRKPMARPEWLEVCSGLRLSAANLEDNSSGWDHYAEILAHELKEGSAGTSSKYVKMSRGWVLGSEQFKCKLVREYQLGAERRSSDLKGCRDLSEQNAMAHLHQLMVKLGKTQEDASKEAKSAAWKLVAVSEMKQSFPVNNAWLADKLCMGAANIVSQAQARIRKTPSTFEPWLAKIRIT